MIDWQRDQLVEGIRDTVERYLGDSITEGPWEDFIGELTQCIADGEITLGQAARMDHLLRRTRGDEGRTACDTCSCPVPGLSHREHG